MIVELLENDYFWGCMMLGSAILMGHYSSQKDVHRANAFQWLDGVLAKHKIRYPDDVKKEINETEEMHINEIGKADKKMMLSLLVLMLSTLLWASTR
jgi:hypothetical protein